MFPSLSFYQVTSRSNVGGVLFTLVIQQDLLCFDLYLCLACTYLVVGLVQLPPTCIEITFYSSSRMFAQPPLSVSFAVANSSVGCSRSYSCIHWKNEINSETKHILPIPYSTHSNPCLTCHGVLMVQGNSDLQS